MISSVIFDSISPHLSVADAIALCYINRSIRDSITHANCVWTRCAEKLGLAISNSNEALSRVWSYLQELKKDALSFGKITISTSIRSTAYLFERIREIDNQRADSEDPASFMEKNIQLMPKLDISLASCTSLSFVSNSIKKIVSFKSLQNLQEVYLSDNKIEILPLWLLRLPHLTGLFVSENLIQHLPPEIGEAKQLCDLDIGLNPLTQLPDEMGDLVRLQDLLIDEPLFPLIPKKLLRNKNLLINDMSVKAWKRRDEEIEAFFLPSPKCQKVTK